MITAAEQRKIDEKFLRQNWDDEGGAGEEGPVARNHVDGRDPKSGTSPHPVPDGAGPSSPGPMGPVDVGSGGYEDHSKGPTAGPAKDRKVSR